MTSLGRLLAALRTLHARARRRPALYALAHVAIVGWFVLGLLATGPVGHVDYPCPDVASSDDLDQFAFEGGSDALVLVSIYPARYRGGGCSSSTLTFGERTSVADVELSVASDHVTVETDEGIERLPVVEPDTETVRDDADEATAFDHRVDTPRPGYPFFVTAHRYSLGPPVRLLGEDGPVVVVQGALDSDPELNGPWFVVILVVLGNATYRIGTHLESRIPAFGDDF